MLQIRRPPTPRQANCGAQHQSGFSVCEVAFPAAGWVRRIPSRSPQCRECHLNFAASRADCSDVRYPWVVYVAPLTPSTCALCALMTWSRNAGIA